MPDTVNTLPHNIEAEQALLGAILMNNEAFHRCSEKLRSYHFWEPLHQEIFEAISSQVERGKVATPITIKDAFDSTKEIVTGMTIPKYLGRLAAGAVTVLNAPDYADLIINLYDVRELICTLEHSLENAYHGAQSQSAVGMISALECALAHHTAHHTAHRTAHREIDTIAQQVLENIKNGAHHEHTVMTNISALDAHLDGLVRSDLIIIAGRPSMGKTTLAMNIAHRVSEQGKSVGVFSMEMSDEQLVMRLISSQSKIDSKDMKKGLEGVELQRVEDATHEVAKLPLHIDQTGALTIELLSLKARRMKRDHDIQLLVIDYLQLMTGEAVNRVHMFTDITTKLKALAKELDIPIICLSQLSRQVEHRENKRPTLADLRESGSIEQDADVVMFVYREEYYYKKENEHKASQGANAYVDYMAELSKIEGKAEVIIAKFRNGEPGTVNLKFDAKTTTFS